MNHLHLLTTSLALVMGLTILPACDPVEMDEGSLMESFRDVPLRYQLCEQDWYDCLPCDGPGEPPCTTTTDGSGWLCCAGSMADTPCYPADHWDDSCSGDILWCDFYAYDPGDNGATCYDMWGQG